MPFGGEARATDLSRGLILFIDETNIPPGASIVAKNFSFDETGTMKKRKGYTRILQKKFTGPVRGIALVHNCFDVEGLIIASAAILDLESL